MPREVIMPALGMAQDTGHLVSWLKAPGDRVAADDPLMEVETDKTVMEVPAGADGILSDIRAEAGEDIPVGQVMALIRLDGEEEIAVDAGPMVETKAPEQVPEREEPAPGPGAAQPPPSADLPRVDHRNGDRILASPKARRLALERGIDLHRLVADGAPQPIHAADLTRAATLTAPRPASGRNLIAARCDRAPFDGFLTAMMERASVVLEPHVLAAAFAAASLRPGHEGLTITVAVEAGPALNRVLYSDPDLTRPSRPRMAGEGTEPDLILRDLTWSRLTSLSLATDGAPALTLGTDGSGFTLSLAYTEQSLTLDRAIALLHGMAERLENPMENLV